MGVVDLIWKHLCNCLASLGYRQPFWWNMIENIKAFRFEFGRGNGFHSSHYDQSDASVVPRTVHGPTCKAEKLLDPAHDDALYEVSLTEEEHHDQGDHDQHGAGHQ